jgi:hypothetical protein
MKIECQFVEDGKGARSRSVRQSGKQQQLL